MNDGTVFCVAVPKKSIVTYKFKLIFASETEGDTDLSGDFDEKHINSNSFFLFILLN